MNLSDGFYGWTDLVDVINSVVRAVPAALTLPIVFIIVQALMTVGDAHDLGNAPAIRATLHGAHMDAHGLAWSLGIATFLTLWGVLARRLHRD
ncbi:hypothetical protein L2Y96_05515 [Luteibacter aegosomaticola]|uniref:hypothetical protein n=1 Tax=Luteibacter aegosomaticola TaxID=2911538 RepID=UPI001FFA4A7E|nr:hypothetical protein [Luteibacter aegosomaticola]UPG91233.1 hypothetical protein L2Y96_05515 [Luteibacter aegosomaticola]